MNHEVKHVAVASVTIGGMCAFFLTANPTLFAKTEQPPINFDKVAT